MLTQKNQTFFARSFFEGGLVYLHKQPIDDKAVNFPIVLPISHSTEYENIHKYPERTR